jgi:outer membrane protein assembly factor BamB
MDGTEGMEMRRRQCRRIRSLVVELLAVGVVLGISVPAAAAPGDWAQLGYGPAHNGYQRDERVLDRTTVRGITRAYRISLGSVGAPVVVGDTIYLTAIAPTARLIALAAADGSWRWGRQLDASAAGAAPAVADGIVYITTQQQESGAGGSLYAFDAISGDRRWRVDGTATTAPVVADGKVFVGGGEVDQPGNVVAHDAADGAVLWTAEAGAYAQQAAPAVSGGRVFVASADGVHAFDETTGTPLWHRAVPGEPIRTPVVAAGTVLTGGFRGIRAIGAASGEPRWAYPETGTHYLNGMPAVANRIVYAHIGGRLVALDLATGGVRWSRTIHPDPTLVTDSSPAVANGVVYIMGVIGGVERLLAYGTGGYLRRMVRAQGDDPIVSNGSVYLGTGRISAYRLPETA